MSLAALGLVLAAAGMHAGWNLLAKRAGNAGGGALFVWLVNVLAAALYAPLAAAIVLVQRPHLGPVELVFFAGSAALQTAYFLLLQRAYRTGDLSLVYPLARGTGPLLATAAAVVLYHERPGIVALAGALLIAAGAVALVANPSALRGARRGARRAAPAMAAVSATAIGPAVSAVSALPATAIGPGVPAVPAPATVPAVAAGATWAGGSLGPVAYALLTGAFIAGYTLWDKYAVGALLIPPLLMHWAAVVGQAALLSPVAVRHRQQVAATWRQHRLAAAGVGLLSPLAYTLVLTALTFTPVSYVAPAREISILIGVLMGGRILKEGHTLRRAAAAITMVLGVVALAVG